MKNPFKRDKRTKLEIEIDDLLAKMAEEEPTSEKYRAMTNVLTDLYRIQILSNEGPKEGILSKLVPTIVTGLFATGQMLIIIHHEQVGIITTKALNYVLRGRS